MSKAPPQRVRITKLQELQIDKVVAIDRACKESLHRLGISAADLPARGLAGMARLTKQHNVLVAEADDVVAGYAAWRDESPGVAYLEEIHVEPALQRLGIGSRLLDAVRQDVRSVALPVLVTRCWAKGPGRAFLTKEGLEPLGDSNERAALWRQEQEAAGGRLAKEGQVVLMQSTL